REIVRRRHAVPKVVRQPVLDGHRPGSDRRKLRKTAAVPRKGARSRRADSPSVRPRTRDPGRLRERGGNVGARSGAALRVPLGEQLLVGEQHDIARDAELERQRARGRQPCRRRHLTGEDLATKRLVDLLPEGLANDELQKHGLASEKSGTTKTLSDWLFAGATRSNTIGERSDAP